MKKSHVIISGTGRAGTTFLVHLLTRLGLDTGFDPATLAVLPAARGARLGPLDMYPTARAGLEMNVRAPDAPYIVKTPFLCDHAEDALKVVHFDHAIIPVRNFEAAAASRGLVQETVTGNRDRVRQVPGGLWAADTVADQVSVLYQKFAKLIEVLVRHDVPITFIDFPRQVRDADYLYRKIRFLLGDTDLEIFKGVYTKVVRPDLVHSFSNTD